MTECFRIKCDNCKFALECVDYGWDGCKKFTPMPKQPQTNFQRITQNEKTLEEFICADMDCAYCVGYGGCERNKDSLVAWLKRESDTNDML